MAARSIDVRLRRNGKVLFLGSLTIMSSILGIHAHTHAHTLPNENSNKGICFGNIYLLVFHAIAKWLEIASILIVCTFSFLCTKCRSVQFRRLFSLHLSRVPGKYSRKHDRTTLALAKIWNYFFCFLKFPDCCFCLLYLSKDFWENKKILRKNIHPALKENLKK